jgi:hypothetical protein
MGGNVFTEHGRWKAAGALFYIPAQYKMKEAAKGQGKKGTYRF